MTTPVYGFLGTPSLWGVSSVTPQLDWNRVAFAGFARSGKDAASKFFLDMGHKRYNFGDIIKRDLDAVIQKRFGFSAFTEIDAEKEMIRNTLEWYGMDAYEFISKEYFEFLPAKCANTRLMRVSEGQKWRALNGVIIEIIKPGTGACSKFEQDCYDELVAAKVITHQVINDGTLWDLYSKVAGLFVDPTLSCPHQGVTSV